MNHRKTKKQQAAVEAARVEVCRSFSFKLNVGNYESRDFFCSQKAECAEKDLEVVSERVHAFCKTQVMKAVRAYEAECRAAYADQKQQAQGARQ